MSSSSASVAVALLCEQRESAAHLRETLAALGASVVYEAGVSTLDLAALAASRAKIVLVNLDGEDDPSIDAAYALLDDNRYQVIFNDAEVTSGLTGWDHARWVRHLAAKIHGDADIDPPRPADAKAVPTPMQAPPAYTPARTDNVEPMPHVSALAAPIAAPIPEVPSRDTPSVVPELADFDVESFGFDLEPVQAAADSALPAILFDDLLAEPHIAPIGTHAVSQNLLDDLDIPPPVMDAFAFDLDVLDEMPAGVIEAALEPGLTDLPALDFDLGFDEIVELSDTAPPAAVASPNWALDDLDELPYEPAPATDATAFGIETVSPAEYLAPVADGDEAEAPMVSLSGLSLELIPLEEAVAPGAAERLDHENWLDPDKAPKAKVQKIWVLGASIGGPESVREFLGELPRDYPALFLLAQHMGDEFVDTMTQQLARATALTVRLPGHGERAGHGEVLVVPNAQRLLVDPNGVVVLERAAADLAYRPSIDRVLQDVADRFGATAGAIIFSGMSDDAAAGCRDLAAKGGRVYVQDPETCVVSTMIDGVRETGVVGFLGSPKELAAKLLAERT